ncbi:MAG: hypothetical protein MUD06_00210 [Rhodospirillales bacterium]|jgi:hypothetical protein|nr:hypothetical protein [Rhodospirillales bacterium]
MVIYELIMCGAQIGEGFVPDISIGSHWAKYWEDKNLSAKYGSRQKFPHRYPDDHPQSRSNPQVANCYPLEALAEYRRWLQEIYLEGGKFSEYLRAKKKEIPPSVAQLAIARFAADRVEPQQ